MWTITEIQQACSAKPGATEDMPFGPTTLTYKVMGKIFCFVGIDAIPVTIAVKGDPERLVELRERYHDIGTGRYLKAKHWAKVTCSGEVPDAVLAAMIDESYALVVACLTRKQRAELAAGTATS